MLKHRRSTLLLAALAGVPLAALPGGSVVLAIVGIGFLIFIHEWGHFYACKLTGTRTETFSIGFGPRLFGWEKDRDGNRRFTTGARQLDPADHAMDFRVALIPLGGYVKMAGELPGEGTEGGAPDEFPEKSASARAFIISAGVIMNFFTAVVFYAIAYGAGKPHEPAVIGYALPGQPAYAAGLRPGDRVLELNGAKIEDRIDLLTEAAMMPRNEEVDVVFERDGKRIGPKPLRARYDEAEGRMLIGITTPGYEFEFGKGDDKFTIGATEPVVIDGVATVGGDAASRRINALVQLGKRSVTVEAGGKTVTLAPTPLEADPEDLPIKIGITSYDIPSVRSVRGPAAVVLRTGDQLISITHEGGASTAITNPLSVTRATSVGAAATALVVERNGERTTLPVALADPQAIATFFGDVDLKFDAESTRIRAMRTDETNFLVDGVLYEMPSAPALDAGLEAGKRVVRVGETDVSSFREITAALKGLRPGSPVDLWVEEDGLRKRVSLKAVALKPLGRFEQMLTPTTEAYEAEGFFGALASGAGRTVREVKNVFRTIGALFAGRLSFQKNIAGPITLVRASKKFADDGFLRLIWFLAYISVMLAVLNILPIPVLDGGHLLFILIEKVKGSPLSDKAMMRFQQVGLLMLLALMFFAFKNDIMRL